MTIDLAESLSADAGTVCVVGAGGKKTLIYRLASELPRSVVTSTVRIPIFDAHVAEVSVTDDPVAVLEAAETWPVGVVPAREDSRYLGYGPSTVDALGAAGIANVLLVKADGARNRLFKAPGDNEPIIPESADTVLPIASVHVVGEPLDEAAVHRPERVARITGRRLGSDLSAADVATVLASEDGGLKDVPAGATAIPVLNMVDNPPLEATAKDIAAGILDRSAVPRVVLTKLIDDDPVVDVIRRSQ